MKLAPAVWVIHRAVDEKRRATLQNAYESARVPLEILEAIDGHGDLANLAPHANFLGSHFWLENKIKPGAFACFLSHIKAWQRLTESDFTHAIIAEDDSAPVPDFQKRLEFAAAQTKKFDFLFLNNRACLLARGKGENAQAAVKHAIAMGRSEIARHGFRAPGADGYLLSKSAAQILLKAVESDKIICGVDWYLLFSALNSKALSGANFNAFPELAILIEAVGARTRLINARIVKPPLFNLNPQFKSTIKHRHAIDIAEFRTQLETA